MRGSHSRPRWWLFGKNDTREGATLQSKNGVWSHQLRTVIGRRYNWDWGVGVGLAAGDIAEVMEGKTFLSSFTMVSVLS